jgi:23S rRNA-/tRNA-specific pseudouridylate synthase
MLHAHVLALDHPLTGKRIEAVSPIPPAFADFAKLLR